jgi:hypothetical protein
LDGGVTLNAIIVSYFAVQAGLLWWALRQNWSLTVRLSAMSCIIALVPILLLLIGAREQFGDGRALNNILIFVSLIGGLAIAVTVLLVQWIMARLPQR